MKRLLLCGLCVVLLVGCIQGCASFKASDIQSIIDSIGKDPAGVCVANSASNVIPTASTGSIIAGRVNADNSSLTLTANTCTITRGSTYNAPPGAAVSTLK
jgi:hypothetical protein